MRRFISSTFLAAALLCSNSFAQDQQSLLAKSKRADKQGWIYVHVEGDAQHRGFQHGYLLAQEINEGVRNSRTAWQYESAMDWQWLTEKAAALFTAKIDKENLAELDGMAAGLKAASVPLTRNDLIAYNAIFELSWYWWPNEMKKIKDGPPVAVPESCSSFIATGNMTKDGNVVIGHNTMFNYEGAFPNVIMDIVPDHGNHIFWQIFPGWIHSGTDFFMTSAGLVGSETTIGGFEGFDEKGVPEFSRMRRATQDANSIDEWCRIMRAGNNGGYANAWLLGDINTKEIARLELGLKYVGFEKKKDGYFIGSNVAENQRILRFETNTQETDIRASSIARRVRWKQLMAENAGKIDLKLAKEFEADHYDTYLNKIRPDGRTLCGHYELDPEPAGPWPGVPYGCAGTMDGKVADAKMVRDLAMSARWGSSCGKNFDAAKFLTAHPQFDWMKDILKSRGSYPWVEFKAGE
jgi:hypothetical protein